MLVQYFKIRVYKNVSQNWDHNPFPLSVTFYYFLSI
jgi:hypothetical protein